MKNIIKTLFVIAIITTIAFAQKLSVEDIIKETSQSVLKIVVYNITGKKRVEGSGHFIKLFDGNTVKTFFSTQNYMYNPKIYEELIPIIH